MEYAGTDKCLSLLTSLYNAGTLQSGAPIKRHAFRGNTYKYTKELIPELATGPLEAARATLGFEVLYLAEKGLIIQEWNK